MYISWHGSINDAGADFGRALAAPSYLPAFDVNHFSSALLIMSRQMQSVNLPSFTFIFTALPLFSKKNH
jgi:hypothetical protein